MVEHRIVVPGVAGSKPVFLPKVKAVLPYRFGRHSLSALYLIYLLSLKTEKQIIIDIDLKDEN